MDALERLQMYSGDLSPDEFSIEEQMNSADDASADLLEGIKDTPVNSIQEVTLEPESQVQPKEKLSESEEETSSNEEIYEDTKEFKEEDTIEKEIKEDNKMQEYTEQTTEQVEKRRGRPPKKHNNNESSNAVYDNIIRNLIEELRKAKHTTQGLDNSTMNIIYDYMQTKF